MQWPIGHLSKTRFSLKVHINLNSALIVEAKPVKSRITKNITNFQIKLIRRLI